MQTHYDSPHKIVIKEVNMISETVSPPSFPYVARLNIETGITLHMDPTAVTTHLYFS